MEQPSLSGVQVGTFDRYARVVSRALRSSAAIVTLVEHDRQVLVGLDGLGSPWRETRETPLTHSVCQHVVREQAPLVIPDAREVDYLVGNGALTELGVVAYAGWPISDHHGRVVGALAAIDLGPRTWSDDDLEALADMADLCSTEMAERTRQAATLADLEESERHGERSRLLLGLSEALSSTRSLEDIARAVSRVTTAELGCRHAGIWVRDDVADADRADIVGRPLRRVLVATPGQPSWPGADPDDEVSVQAEVGAALEAGEARFLPGGDPDGPSAGQAQALLPLLLGGRPLGLLVLVWPGRHDVDAEARVTMAALSAYTAQAVQRAALLEERVSVSVTLQRAMLTELPSVPGLELAARYLPASTREQVGGDWYDAVVLPDGDTLVAVGDVTGHDIVAASVMSQLRSMLRAIVTVTDGPPSRSLTLLDQVVDRVGLATVASALLVQVSPPERSGSADGRWRVTWSRAGHLPAVLVGPGGCARLLGPDGSDLPELAADSDGLLGLGQVQRRDHVLDVEPGSVLLLYTDGLVERRGEVIDLGLERLRAALAHCSGPLDDVISAVLDAQLGGVAPDDDVAVLAVRLG